MATNLNSPGIEAREIDLTGRVPSVDTQTAGIAAHLRWGPVQKPVLVSNPDVLVRDFGEPNANTAEDFFCAEAFLGYSNLLQLVRVVSETSGLGSAVNAYDNSANSAQTLLIKNEDDYNENYSSGVSGVGQWIAKWPGSLGNSIKVSECANSSAWESSLTGNVAITSGTAALSGNNTLFDTELVVGDIVLLGPDREEHQVKTITSNVAVVLESNYTGNTVVINSGPSSSVTRRWQFYRNFDSAPGTTEYANTRGGTSDEIHVAVADADGTWTGTKNRLLETWPALSLGSDAKTDTGAGNYYKDVINQSSRYIWWAAHRAENDGAGFSVANKTFGGPGTPQTSTLVMGRDGDEPSNSDYIRGYEHFVDPDQIDVSFLIMSDRGATVINRAIQNVAEVRGDAIVCYSPERADVVDNSSYSAAEVEDVLAFRDTVVGSSYSVSDSGWKYVYDRYNDLFRYVPLNGDIAGLMARTPDPWVSPAGYTRGVVKNVVKLAWSPNKSERDLLYKRGVNPVISVPGQGILLFGDKTGLLKPSAFDRINVRRLFIALRKAIKRASANLLFEINDEFTRAQFRNLVEPYLRDIQGRRGIYDYHVVCDETNNTPEVIDRNQFIGDIYVKPARTINYITLNFVAVRTGVEFNEIIGRF